MLALAGLAPAVGRAAPSDPLDVDALAARIPSDQAIYQHVRDEALAVLARTQPKLAADPRAATFIRLGGLPVCVG
ncbi:MAG: hypothetical protein WDO13_18730 [Verrucomicrobiota bacterium]